MLPRKRKHLFYATLILAFLVASSSVLAKRNVSSLFLELSAKLEKGASIIDSKINEEYDKQDFNVISSSIRESAIVSAIMPTIIQGADEEVVCANDGSTVARFNLCGNFDDKIMSIE